MPFKFLPLLSVKSNKTSVESTEKSIHHYKNCNCFSKLANDCKLFDYFMNMLQIAACVYKNN